MPVSKKGRPRYHPSAQHARRSKSLYLPMPRADVDTLMLPFRVALEMVRSGCANEATARRLASLVLLVRFLTEAGHGQLDMKDLHNAERTLAEIFDIGHQSEMWSFPEPATETLKQIVNELERQLFETRLEAIAAASARLDALIEKHGTALDLRTV